MCHYIDSQYILLQLEARVFRVPLKKKLNRWKVSSVWNNLIYNLWENDANLNDIDSKHSSSHSFQGNNLHPWVMGFMHAFSFNFFSLVRIYFNFPQSKGDKLYNKNMKKKYWSLCSFKSYRPSTSLPGPFIESNTMLLEFVQAFPPDYTIFMDSRGCTVQFLGITLNIFPFLICFTSSVHVALWLLSNRSQMMSKCAENKKVTH